MAQVDLGLLESQQSSGWPPSSQFQLDVTMSISAYYCSIFSLLAFQSSEDFTHKCPFLPHKHFPPLQPWPADQIVSVHRWVAALEPSLASLASSPQGGSCVFLMPALLHAFIQPSPSRSLTRICTHSPARVSTTHTALSGTSLMLKPPCFYPHYAQAYRLMGEKPNATQILFSTTIYLKQLCNTHFSHLWNRLEITAIPQGYGEKEKHMEPKGLPACS